MSEMPKKITLTLEPEQQLELVYARDKHPKPYIRERAAALLKVAAGQYYEDVAAAGLLISRCRQSVASWIKRYQQEGLPGLLVKKGRGRKPIFFSSPENLGGSQRRATAPSHTHA
jgi:Winged helix-turn helix